MLKRCTIFRALGRGRKGAGLALLISIVFMVFLIAAPVVFADSNDFNSNLVNKLVNKGVISQSDANALLAQSNKEQASSKLPDWLKKLTLSGDFRLRYEYIDVQGQGIAPINRARIRYRLYLTDQVVDSVKLVFGVASGGESPVLSRSTNVTLGNSFAGKLPRIDEAYVQYTPSKIFTIAGGKFPNPIWAPSMLTWDYNIRPEGVFAMLTPPASGNLDFFLNTDFFVLDQLVNKSEFGAAMPYMGVINPGADWKFAENGKVRLAAAYYIFDNLKRTYQFSSQLPGAYAQGGLGGSIGQIFAPTGTNNTLDSKGNLVYNYNDLWVGGQADFNKLSGVLPYAGPYAEYIYNPAPSNDNQGYIMGVKLGDASTAGAGLWQIDYSYRRLERNAWLDIFPDADFFYGSTNVMGNRTSLTVGLAKNMATAITWYNEEQIEPNSAINPTPKPVQTTAHTENTVQVDLMMSF